MNWFCLAGFSNYRYQNVPSSIRVERKFSRMPSQESNSGLAYTATQRATVQLGYDHRVPNIYKLDYQANGSSLLKRVHMPPLLALSRPKQGCH